MDLDLVIEMADMKLLVGSHVSYNQWSVDYSNKPNSATDRLYVNMEDTGIGMLFDFGNIFFQLGAGSSKISSAMVVHGRDIPYSYSGNKYSYTSFGLGTKFGDYAYASIGGTRYSGYAKYCNRVELNLGLSYY